MPQVSKDQVALAQSFRIASETKRFIVKQSRHVKLALRYGSRDHMTDEKPKGFCYCCRQDKPTVRTILHVQNHGFPVRTT